MENGMQIRRYERRHETDRRITSRGGGRKQAGLQHKHAILCSQLMAHSFLSHTHIVQCSHTLPHIIHNAHRHACLKHLLYSPTHVIQLRVRTLLLAKLPTHKGSNYHPGIHRAAAGLSKGIYDFLQQIGRGYEHCCI